MAININYYLNNKFDEIQIPHAIKTEDLYSDVPDRKLKLIFATLHQEFNRLISFMYKKTNGHFNAEESRDLDKYITLYDDMKYVLKDSNYSFELDNEYDSFLNECKTFIVTSGGSTIPDNLNRIRLKEYEPIFFLTKTIKTDTSQEKRYPLNIIGSGSYAKVFKYHDEFYDMPVIIKRANKDLTSKELERFKREFNVMKKLNSPYILKVYKYDDKNNEYYAEYVDETLYNFIIKNNNKLSNEKRKNIAYQIFKAFKYIHSKELLHRDISLTNVLIKHYDNSDIIKISDFGLVKEKDSTLTSLESEMKGSLNDSNLAIIGFSKYSIQHETYALTRLILFVMTGKTNIEKVTDTKIKNFVNKGTNGNVNYRYKNIDDMILEFNKTF